MAYRVARIGDAKMTNATYKDCAAVTAWLAELEAAYGPFSEEDLREIEKEARRSVIRYIQSVLSAEAATGVSEED